LALSGVGHVHHQPDRALRLADVSEFSAAGPPAAGSPADAPVGAPHHARSSGTGIDAPSAADFAVLSTNLRRAAPTINIHPPVTQHRIALVVLAGDGPPAPSLAAELTGQRIPHLAVSAGMTKAVLGPFVLPGRSSCLLCALRQRTELDDGRPALEEDMRRQLVVPPAQLVASATALAVGDALDHVDGVRIPGTVDGTVEWQLGDLAPRRRSWAAHPDCGCRSTGAPDSRLADRPGA
jgi:hypothetical protein